LADALTISQPLTYLLPAPLPSLTFLPADTYGPRFGIGLCIGLTAPAVYCIALCSNAAGFIISRLFIGFSLATFVACQFWCTSMFNTKVVGTANALAAGWVSGVLAVLL
jgi:nitrate/nitrite transporter NarK